MQGVRPLIINTIIAHLFPKSKWLRMLAQKHIYRLQSIYHEGHDEHIYLTDNLLTDKYHCELQHCCGTANTLSSLLLQRSQIHSGCKKHVATCIYIL